MPTTYKILGQVAPSTTSETVLYTVPAGTSAVASSIAVANRSSSGVASFRIAISPAGASTVNSHYLYYDVPIGQNDTFIATIGITLATTDVVKVQASTVNLSFQLFGSELT